MPAQSFTISERLDGIGASEVGALLGVSKFKSAYELAQEKKGLIEPSEPGNLAIRGSELEEIVARRVEQDHEIKLRRMTKKFSNSRAPLFCHLDRIFSKEKKICEIKTTNPHSFQNSYLDSEFGMPEYIWYQLQAQFACRPDMTETLLAICIVENWEFHYQWIQPCSSTIARIEEEVDWFWKHCVQGDQLPRHLGLDDLRSIEPTQDVLLADDESEDMIRRLTEIKQQKEYLIKEEKELQSLLANQLLDHHELQSSDGKWLARFKPRKSTRFDSKAFKAEDPETYSRFEKQSESRTLTLNYKVYEDAVVLNESLTPVFSNPAEAMDDSANHYYGE